MMNKFDHCETVPLILAVQFGLVFALDAGAVAL
jgi:hypothetical protein